MNYPDPLDDVQRDDLTDGLKHVWDTCGRDTVVTLIREAYGVPVSIPRFQRIPRLMARYIAEHYNPAKEKEFCIFLDISPAILRRYLKDIERADLSEIGCNEEEN